MDAERMVREFAELREELEARQKAIRRSFEALRDETSFLDENELRSPDDLARLNPQTYSDLQARPASWLDLLRLQLGVSEALRNMSEQVTKALEALSR